MKRCLFVFCLLIFVGWSYGQRNKHIYKIWIKEFGVYMVPDSCVGHYVKKNPNEKTKFYKIYLKDCKGAMDIECYSSKDSSLLEKGSYVNSLGVLCTYVNEIGSSLKMHIGLQYYYQPLKNGHWFTYDSKGNVIKEELYENGILVE
jgi:antitoxin component YwqK of YwqJK toxin-antitoxin module